MKQLGHDGPVQAWISKAPEGKDVTTYDGSGQWIKVYTVGVKVNPDQTGYFAIEWLAMNSGYPPLVRALS